MASERELRDHGMADAGRDEVAALVLPAWDAFLGQVAEVDLDRRTRLPGWRAREIAVHLGCWPDHTVLADLTADARADVTGALAASSGLTGGATLATPDGGWRFAADDDGWTVRRLPAGDTSGTAVEAPAALLLEAASGRVNPVTALARRRLKVHELGG